MTFDFQSYFKMLLHNMNLVRYYIRKLRKHTISSLSHNTEIPKCVHFASTRNSNLIMATYVRDQIRISFSKKGKKDAIEN